GNELGEETSKPSYHRTTPRKLAVHTLTKAHINVPDMPAVTAVRPPNPAPVREEVAPEVAEPVALPVVVAAPMAKRGFMARLKALFFGDEEPTVAAAPLPAAARGGRSERGERNDRGERGERSERGERGGNRRDRGERGARRDRGSRDERAARNGN